MAALWFLIFDPVTHCGHCSHTAPRTAFIICVARFFPASPFLDGCLLLAWQIQPHAEVETPAGDPFRAFLVPVEMAAIVFGHR